MPTNRFGTSVCALQRDQHCHTTQLTQQALAGNFDNFSNKFRCNQMIDERYWNVKKTAHQISQLHTPKSTIISHLKEISQIVTETKKLKWHQIFCSTANLEKEKAMLSFYRTNEISHFAKVIDKIFAHNCIRSKVIFHCKTSNKITINRVN